MKQMQQGKTAKESTSALEEVVASYKVKTDDITKKGDKTMESKKGFAGFDTQSINENVLKMMKFSMDKSFEGLTKVQEFNDKIIKDTIKSSKQIQADSEKLVGEWAEEGKKGLDEYRKVVEEGYKKFEALIVP